MSQLIVTSIGYVITRRTVRLIRTSELHSETENRKQRIFDCAILKKLGDSVTIPTSTNARHHAPYFNNVDPDSVQLPEDNGPFIPDGTAVFEKTITNQWIHA